jgi:hypothetical protein
LTRQFALLAKQITSLTVDFSQSIDLYRYQYISYPELRLGTKQQTPGSRLKSIAGKTILVRPGSKHCWDEDIGVSRLKSIAGMVWLVGSNAEALLG